MQFFGQLFRVIACLVQVYAPLGHTFFLLKFLEYSILKFGTYRVARFWNIPFSMEYPRIFQILFGTYIVWENLEYDNLFGIFRKNIRDIPVVKKMEYGIFR